MGIDCTISVFFFKYKCFKDKMYFSKTVVSGYGGTNLYSRGRDWEDYSAVGVAGVEGVS
jgi:hypothetical protein